MLHTKTPCKHNTSTNLTQIKGKERIFENKEIIKLRDQIEDLQNKFEDVLNKVAKLSERNWNCQDNKIFLDNEKDITYKK